MSFTEAQLRLLALSDSLPLTDAPRRNVGGRPRLPPTSDAIMRRRASWRRYEDKKHDRLNAFGQPRKQGGRPKSAPNTPRQERARQRALARYYRLKEQRHAPPE